MDCVSVWLVVLGIFKRVGKGGGGGGEGSLGVQHRFGRVCAL